MAAAATRSSFNGTPSSGQVNSGPPFGFSSSVGVKRDYGSLPSIAALQNPTLHNKVPEAMVNATARAPIFVRPFTRGFEKSYSEGDLLFVRRGDERASNGHNVVCNLPVFNYMLRTEKSDDGSLKYGTMDAIKAHWNFLGIFNNDMDTGSKWQRLLNVNVRGRSRVARLWEPSEGRLRKGDCVWLSFVGREHDEESRPPLDPSGSRFPMMDGTQYIEVRATMDCCADYKGALLSIPVGIVSQTTMRKPSAQSQELGHYVTENCKSLERIEVLMRI